MTTTQANPLKKALWSRFTLTVKDKHWGSQALLVVAIFLVWEILALTIFRHRFVLPTPVSILSTAWQDHFYGSDLLTTLSEAGPGWLIGNGLAILLALAVLLSPKLESSLLSFGVMTYAVPTVALGPILFIMQTPYDAKVTMSALSVFFVTLIASVAGLRAASRTSLEMASAFGASKLQILTKVRIRASIPSIAGGLCISAPASILGAVIGDYFGGQSGLGVVMLQAQEQLSVSRTWAIALVTTVVSAAVYSFTLWMTKVFGAGPSVGTDFASAGVLDEAKSRFVPIVKTTRVLFGLGLSLLAWDLIVHASGLGGYFLKTPLDVWHYLFQSPAAALDRQAVFSTVATTLFHAGTGWALGTLFALIGAILLILFPQANATIMPLVLVVRSVPLIAMTPLIALLFGRGLLGITIIAALVTVVPSLVTISDGLRSAPRTAMDLVTSLGGNRIQTLLRVQSMYGMPAIFTAAKISMPGAILGAVLAEWMVSDSGVGHAMAYDVIGSNFSNLWASISVVVALSLMLYFGVGALERGIRSRLAIT